MLLMYKKLVFFVGSLEKGGAERVISILSRQFVEAGYDIEILLYYDRNIYYQIDERIKITTIEFETGTKRIASNVMWMRQYLKKQDVCIISFLAPFNIVALVAAWGLKNPIIVADRNDPRKVPEKFLVRKLRDFLYGFADRVVVQTSYNKAYFHKKVVRKTDIIFNPLDLGEMKGVGHKIEKKKKIVSVGRLMPQKNQRILINSFHTLHMKYPDYSLYIYGEGPERNNLQKQIDDLNLHEAVYLAGQVDDVFSNIVDAELFVLCSDYEGMPNALIEAMGMGLPVISTRVSGATDMIVSGENGFLVNVGDESQLTKTMLSMVENEELRNFCAINAVKVSDVLATDKIVAQWLNIIEEVKHDY